MDNEGDHLALGRPYCEGGQPHKHPTVTALAFVCNACKASCQSVQLWPYASESIGLGNLKEVA